MESLNSFLSDQGCGSRILLRDGLFDFIQNSTSQNICCAKIGACTQYFHSMNLLMIRVWKGKILILMNGFECVGQPSAANNNWRKLFRRGSIIGMCINMNPETTLQVLILPLFSSCLISFGIEYFQVLLRNIIYIKYSMCIHFTNCKGG